MRPRQNLRDFHHNSQPSSSYQSMNHNQNLLQQQLQQSMAAQPQPPAATPPLLGQPATGRGIQPSLAAPDMIAELIKLGLNPDDMARQSNRPDRREDLFKNLQAMLGKREAAELLQKLPPLNDLFMQSLTPDGYSRSAGGNSGGVANPRDSVICGPGGMLGGGGSAGGSGPTSFTNNNINNGNSSKQQEQDIQYSSAQHQANHHQHFRIPTTNTTTVHNSPQQQQQQQHKSVLSLHQQQQHQHDPTNRRLNHQQHGMSSASSSSFTNLNDMGRAPSSSSSSLEPHNPNIFSRVKTSPPLNPYTKTSAGSAPRASNLMDALGASGASSVGHPGQLDNLYDNNAFQQHNLSSSNHNQQQSLIRQQQLQRLLRYGGSGGGAKNSMPLPPSNMSSRNDSHVNQRHGNANINSMSQIQRQLTSPNASSSSSAISPPQQALSSVPKSLLNLAACTSKSPPVANNLSSMGKNSRVFPQQPQQQQQQQSSYNSGSNSSGGAGGGGASISNPVPNNRTGPPSRNSGSGSANGAFTRSAPLNVDASNLLQQMIARSSQAKGPNSGTVNRGGASNNSQTLTSLLSDDQKSSRANTNAGPSQPHAGNPTRAHQQPVPKRPTQSSDDSSNVQTSVKSKEAYLAYLQERASKAGVSIGEINKTTANQTSTSSQSNSQNLDINSNPSSSSSSSLLSRNNHPGLQQLTSDKRNTEARNDLSLLYPPISLAASSQRQLNFLAAGLEAGGDNLQDNITDEVKKIIQEECNIIYECKGCSNLFRSVANLVRHKRQFCDNSNSERANVELNRQFYSATNNNNNHLSQSEAASLLKPPSAHDTYNTRQGTGGTDLTLMDARRPEHLNASVSIGSQKYNLRGRRIDSTPELPSGDSRFLRSTRTSGDQRELQAQSNDMGFTNMVGGPAGFSAHQTNLSRLLQSQPKNRQPQPPLQQHVAPHQMPAKDSALMNALNMPNPSTSRRSVINSNPRGCSINELNEQLVKNSSLAKTLLLNENARSINSSALQLTRSIVSKPKTGPKRKLLEDCIQKVKRDKLATGEEGEHEVAAVSASDHLGRDAKRSKQSLDDMNQFKDPLAIDDSGTDSDALVMDLDEPRVVPKSRRKSTRELRSSGDRLHERSANNNNNNNKLNTSSALLKALTRPVETRSSYMGNLRSSDDKISVGSASSTETQDVSSLVAEKGDEAQSTGTQEGSMDDAATTSTAEDEAGREQDEEVDEEEAEAMPPSPLFDKYTCELCETDLEDQASLLAHTMDRHKKEKKIYPCLFCSFTFITLENVCRHIIDMHKKTKTQVGHLKEVVRSRSFISSDFRACSDCPAMAAGDNEASDEQDDGDNISPPDAPDSAPVQAESVDTRRSSSALSDSVATKQILEDTLALVSNTSSPDRANTGSASTASSNRLAAILSRARHAAGRRNAGGLDTGGTNKLTAESAAGADDVDDPLSDSLLTNLTEHLAILESQEAEIEAEKQRRAQAGGADPSKDGEDSGRQAAAAAAKIKAEPTESASEAGPASSVRDEEASEASVEFRNQQTTPSRGKHIVAGQPFNSNTEEEDDEEEEEDDDDDDEEAQNSDQDEEGEDGAKVRGDNELAFARASHSAANNGPYGDVEMDEADESQGGGTSDQSAYGGQPELGEGEDDGDAESNPDSPGNSESLENDDERADYQGEVEEDEEEEEDDNEEEEEDEDDDEEEDEDDDGGQGYRPARGSPSKQRQRRTSQSMREHDDDDDDDDDEDEDAAERTDKGDDSDLNPAQTAGEELALSRGSGSHSSRASSKASTMDVAGGGGGGGCKLKVKSSVLREAGAGATGSSSLGGQQGAAASAAGGSGAAAENSGGGIKKLKIQLKAQPDEKSKVYRIVN